MSKFKIFYYENKAFLRLLLGCIVLLVLFVGVATLSGSWPGTDASAQILSALAGAVVAAIITLFLLLGQTSSEEKKERNTKVFEEKLRIYQDFLHCLYDVIKDGEVTKEEAIKLEFQTSYITMHTDSARIKEIAEQVKNIVDSLNEDFKSSNSNNGEEKEAMKNNILMKNLFGIVNEFKKELYPSISSEDEKKEEDDESTKKSIEAFSSIIEAVEVKKTMTSTSDIDVGTQIDMKQILSDFTVELLKRLEINKDYWKVEMGDMSNGININIAKKGNEEGVKVILNSEDNGEQYYQIHLDYGDTHEAYKHMKWRFGGRQNSWCWYKYLDTSIRNLAALDEMKSKNWIPLLNAISKQLKLLVAYVETFEKIRYEIFQPAPKKVGTKVWLYYEKCVAFDFDDTKENDSDKLFMDVVLEDNGLYSILFGNRGQNIQNLLERLNAIGLKVSEIDIQENRYILCKDIPASEVVAKVEDITLRIK